VKAEGPAAARPAPGPPAGAARRPAAFAVALARAQARAGRAPGGPPSLLAGATLARRRRGADDTQGRLGERREEAEPGRPGAVARAVDAMPLAAEVRSPEPSGRAALLPPSALERLAVEAGRAADRATLDLRFGQSLEVRLTRSRAGVDVVLRPGAGLRASAEAEVPALVAALRARGVSVGRVEVRTGATGLPPGRARALTPSRGSATTGPSLHPGGTVAKW
jgi:hypothetical protein